MFPKKQKEFGESFFSFFLSIFLFFILKIYFILMSALALFGL